MSERKRRIFFALWPDEPTRQALVRATRTAVRRCGGRAVPAANLHVTLAFLGPVTEADLPAVVGVPPLRSPPMELVLDKLGYWKGSRALWVAPSTVPRGLVALQSSLWGALEGVGFERDVRPYRPHVTLARKAKSVEESFAPVSWPVTGLALVESKPGARHPVYEVLEAWPFEPES